MSTEANDKIILSEYLKKSGNEELLHLIQQKNSKVKKSQKLLKYIISNNKKYKEKQILNEIEINKNPLQNLDNRKALKLIKNFKLYSEKLLKETGVGCETDKPNKIFDFTIDGKSKILINNNTLTSQLNKNMEEKEIKNRVKNPSIVPYLNFVIIKNKNLFYNIAIYK